MKNADGIRICKKCGKQIGIITWGIYRKTVVDLLPVMVKADPVGEDYVRVDGSKVKAVEVPYDSPERAEVRGGIHILPDIRDDHPRGP